MRRRAAVVPVLVALVGMALALSSCGNSGLTLARQACGYVKTSIHLYTEAEHDDDPRRAAALRTKATVALEAALPLAAQADAADGQWNPLMTTLQEAGRNSEANLVQALTQQCAQAAKANEQAPAYSNVPSSTVPGQPTPSTLPGQ